MKVLLIHLVPPRSVWPRGLFRSYWVPTGVAFLAGVLQRAGHDVRLLCREEQLIKHKLDWQQADAELVKLVQEFGPEMIGLSVVTPAMPEAARLAALCRQALGRPVLIVAGGPHPTALPEQTLAEVPAIDAVIVGEGELTLRDLADRGLRDSIEGLVFRQDGQFVTTPPRAPVRNLDSLGAPAYNLLDLQHYASVNRWMIRFLPLRVTNIRTSRGCSHRCDFCGGHLVAGLGLRLHSLDYVMDQVRHAVDVMGVQAVHFEDDTLAANPQRLMELCERICRAGLHKRLQWDCCMRVDQARRDLLVQMKGSGCIQVEFGFESGSDDRLRALGKSASTELNRRAVSLAREAGLRVFADIMVGLPGETRADLKATLAFLRWAKPEILSAVRLCPLPGTKVYTDLSDEKRRKLTWEGFTYFDPPGFACNLTAMSDRAFERFYRSFSRHFVKPLTSKALLRDTPLDDTAERRRLTLRLRNFALRHPIHAMRLSKC